MTKSSYEEVKHTEEVKAMADVMVTPASPEKDVSWNVTENNLTNLFRLCQQEPVA